MSTNPIAIFTKPWKCSTNELGQLLQAFGVDGLELPVRPGYPVTPDNMAEELPRAANELRKFGQTIFSVAGTPSPAMVKACGEAGIPIIRVCENIDRQVGYMASVDKIKRTYEQLLPTLEQFKVKIGLQNHCDYCIGSAIGTMHVIGQFDPEYVGAVLDLAHCGLDGEPVDMAIDISWSHLCMVNLKNAFRVRTNGPEAEEAQWRIHWTTGRHGYASWSKTIETLKKRQYSGPICLTAEYSQPDGHGELSGDSVNRLIKEDIQYARQLLGE